MKPFDLLSSALGGGASALGSAAILLKSASTLTVILGAIYLADCRFSSRTATREAIDSCYFTALPLMGVGVGARAGFQAGFSTLNPALRRPEDDLRDLLQAVASSAAGAAPPAGNPPEDAGRDSHGRFTRRS